MAILTKSDLNRLVGQSYKSWTFTESIKKAVTDEERKQTKYDVFLSHSHLDRETILQINYLLEAMFGLKVFVDWIETPETNRSAVTTANAAYLRDVMGRSATLLYAISTNSSSSKWMPWELGYSDAKHGRVAVLPIADTVLTASAYSDQEFVGLYPYIDITNGNTLCVNSRQSPGRFSSFDTWRRTGQFTSP